MTALPGPDQDMHVHSTFSDGQGTIEQNLEVAERLGLSKMTCVDHVRGDTDWAPEFVREVRRLAAETEVELRCALEAKLLATDGSLDLPADTGGADLVYAADHQLPLEDGPADPAAVRTALAEGEMEPAAVIAAVIEATVNAVAANDAVVVAHLFSLLPKLGLDERAVPAASLDRMAVAIVAAGAKVEIDERWRCPSARTIRAMRSAGVEILLSTDSHSTETIGRYDYCLGVIGELEGAGR